MSGPAQVIRVPKQRVEVSASSKTDEEPGSSRSTRMQQSAFLIRFETENIAPANMPDFPYVAVALKRATIEYAAMVHAVDANFAMADIGQYWPDAQYVSAEYFVGEFKAQTEAILSPVRGFLPPPAPVVIPSRRSRLWAWLRSWFF